MAVRRKPQPWRRKARSMPSTAKIAAHHGLPDGECWRCGRVGYVQRAHIVDRMEWSTGAGLDTVQNLALLCGGCHLPMLPIRPEDWEFGLLYVGIWGCWEREDGDDEEEQD